MSDRESAEGCLVALLLPHPTRTAVLVTDVEPATGPTSASLPTVWLNKAEPELNGILDSVDVIDPATSVVLRQVNTSASETKQNSLMLEFDTAAAEPPTGLTWLDLDDETIAQLEPQTCRAAVAAWVRERTDGWSPLRPPWSLPGWFGRACTWTLEQMVEVGRPAIGAPRQHLLWGPSVVLSAPSAAGHVFFKCSADLFRHEAVVTRALAERMPGRVPEVIAVDAAQGWLLMRDFGAAELGEQDQSLWQEGLVAHAGIQQSWLGRTDELIALGLPVRSLTDLALRVEAMSDDAVLMDRMPADLRARWLAATPTLAKSCRRLHEIGPGPSLVHGDLHPWNVALGPGVTCVFDWTDAAVSHPFVDLATYVSRTEDSAVRRRLVDAYVGAWSGLYPYEALREAADLALVVGALYQIETYRTLLPTLMRNGADDGLATGDLGWIGHSLTFHEERLQRLD